MKKGIARLMGKAMNALMDSLTKSGANPTRYVTSHKITFQTALLPYHQLDAILQTIHDETGLMVKEFNYSSRALGGDSIGWEVTFQLKDIELIP